MIVIVDDHSSVHFDHGVERKAQGSSFLAYFNVVCVGKLGVGSGFESVGMTN